MQLYGGGGLVWEMDKGGGDSSMRLSGGIEKSVNQTFGLYVLTTYDLKVERNHLKITAGVAVSLQPKRSTNLSLNTNYFVS